MWKLWPLLFIVLFAVPALAQENDPYQIALQRIEEARVSGATFLSLSGHGLTELPPEIGQLISLERLELSNNQLTDLPPEIGQLINLQTLDLSENQLTSLPPEIGNLRYLCILNISHNQLRILPGELGQLEDLASVGGYCLSLSELIMDDNPLIYPPFILYENTEVFLEYLRDPITFSLKHYSLWGAGISAIVIASVLSIRWRNRRTMGKQKREL